MVVSTITKRAVSVEAVYPETRELKLLDSQGNRFRVTVDELVPDFDKIEPRDRIVAEYLESVALIVAPHDSEPLLGDDRVAAIGTPGGGRIITMVLLGILDFMEGNGPESWVSLPRFHHQYMPDRISAEPDAFTAEEVAALEALGHVVEVRTRSWGNMHGAMWNRETGEVSAGSDARSDAGLAVVR